MELLGWTAPGGGSELALGFGPAGGIRVLVLPAWFDEANKLRHFTVETMRALEKCGIASVRPDLPGCNESLAPLATQHLGTWREAAAEAAHQHGCTHVLAIRAAVTVAPDLPGWAYAPVAGKAILRALLRARTIAAKEAGREESSTALLDNGRAEGLDLAGYRLGPEMVRELAEAELPANRLASITAADLGGLALWLRAEPEHDPAQADALAGIVARGIGQ